MSDTERKTSIRYIEENETLHVDWAGEISKERIQEKGNFLIFLLQKLRVKTIITNVFNIDDVNPFQNRKHLVASLNLIRSRGVREMKIYCATKGILKTLRLLFEQISKEYNILLKLQFQLQPKLIKA